MSRSDATGYVDDPQDEPHTCIDCGDALTLGEGIRLTGAGWLCDDCAGYECPTCGCVNTCVCDDWEASAER